ncbi:S-4TM family putative pore-forming effector, partial [Dysosmobacter sp.]
ARNSFFFVRTCANSSLSADRLICLFMNTFYHIAAVPALFSVRYCPKKELAASIQQKFDIYVYTMPWDNRIFGKNKNLNQKIAEYSKKLLSNAKEKQMLYNWYASPVDEKELYDGILSCQRENYSWDVGIRKRYRSSCIFVIIILTIIVFAIGCNGVQREHNKKLNNGLPILHKVPPKRDYGRYFCIMAEKGGTSHGGLTEKLSPFFHAKKQEVNAYGR